MGSSELVEELAHLGFTLMIFYLGWWPDSEDCETWLEWWLVWRYLVALVIVADYAALLGHPRMHTFFTGLQSQPGCILILEELDGEDLQLLL